MARNRPGQVEPANTEKSAMVRAKIVGAGGYGGVGMTELLHGHPEAELVALVDVDAVGSRISDHYPHLRGFIDTRISSSEDPVAQEEVDVVFFATPDGVGMTLAPAELDRGARVIDYSGDFRFNNTDGEHRCHRCGRSYRW